MIRKLNRIFQEFMREKRMRIGKYIWDKKEKISFNLGNNFMKDNNIQSIVFLRYDGKIGDTVVNTLMFREIKKKYPKIKIAVVIRGEAKKIIENNPYVDKIYNYEKNKRKIKKLAEEIKNDKYDLLVDFSEMLRVNEMMLINLVKARFNIGLDKKDWQLFDISVSSGEDFSWQDHITKRYLAYLKKLGFAKDEVDLSYDIYTKSDFKYSEFFKSIKKGKIVVLNPYGASKHKCFNLEILDKIIKYLKILNTTVILIYFSDKYKELEVLKKTNSNLYIPKNIKTILDSAYIINYADYVISPDTSIVHIASALNKTIISVYPPNGGRNGVDHLVWAPKSKNSKIIFCRERKSKYDEIDINTFDFEEMKREINKINKLIKDK